MRDLFSERVFRVWGGNFEGVEQIADRVVGPGQYDHIDDSVVSECFSGLGKHGIVGAL
jgi:hypothetical protein